MDDTYGARGVYLDARDGAGLLRHGDIRGHAIVPRGREGRGEILRNRRRMRQTQSVEEGKTVRR